MNSLQSSASRRDILSELCSLAKESKLLCLSAVVFNVLGSFLSLLPVLLLARVIDLVVARGRSEDLVSIVVLALLACLGAMLISALSESCTGIVIANVVSRLREQVAAAVLRLSPVQVERFGRGEVLGRVGADIAVLAAASRKAVPATISAVILVLVASMGVAGLDWRLAIAGLCGYPFYWLALRWYLPKSAPIYIKQREIEAELQGSLEHSLKGRMSMRSHGLVAQRKRVTLTQAVRSRDESIKAFRVFTGLVQRENFAEFLGLSSLFIVGWFLFKSNHVTVGEVSSALILFHRQFVPIGTILFSFDELQRCWASLSRIISLVQMNKRQVPQLNPVIDLPESPPELVVRDLSYQYVRDQEVLSSLSMVIPPGKTVCLVGRSGSGKSTLAGILSGALLPNPQAEITLGGREFSSFRLEEWQSLVCVASQDSFVFSRSLRENLLLASADASDDQLWKALSLTGAKTWCQQLRFDHLRGLNTPLGDSGVHVDPAVAQRIALTRVALSPAELVILDESTAEDQVDLEFVEDSSGIFDQSLEQAAISAIRGRTAIVIAHRLSQAKTADYVALMEDGRLVDMAPHEELLERSASYAQLWEAWNK